MPDDNNRVLDEAFELIEKSLDAGIVCEKQEGAEMVSALLRPSNDSEHVSLRLMRTAAECERLRAELEATQGDLERCRRLLVEVGHPELVEPRKRQRPPLNSETASFARGFGIEVFPCGNKFGCRFAIQIHGPQRVILRGFATEAAAADYAICTIRNIARHLAELGRK